LEYGIVTVTVTKNSVLICWEKDDEGEHVKLPEGASESSGQSEHVIAPTAAEYLPMSHSVHVSDPAAAEYLPATHKVHTAEEVADEVVEYFPVLQAAQVVADEVEEYVPTSQSTQSTSPLV
jgi:hypothetical protein